MTDREEVYEALVESLGDEPVTEWVNGVIELLFDVMEYEFLDQHEMEEFLIRFDDLMGEVGYLKDEVH